MPHGRAQVGYYELGLTRDGVITGLRARVVADSGAYAGFGGGAGHRPDLHDVPGRLRHPEDRLRRRGGADQHHPDGRVPRRRPAGGHRPPGADDGPGRRRAGPGPGASSAGATSSRPDAFPFDHRLRDALRHRRLRPAAARGAAAGRLRRAARRAGRAAARPATRCSWASASRVYVEITAGGGGSEYGSVTVHADGTRHHLGRHLGARPGPRHGVRHARAATGSASRSSGSASCSPTPRPCRAAAAPAARARCRWAAAPCRPPPTTCWSRPGGGPRTLLEAAVDDVELTDGRRVRGGRRARRRR